MDEPIQPKSNRTITTHKVFDVAKPGKSVPSQNARPAILTQSALPKTLWFLHSIRTLWAIQFVQDTEELFDEPDVIKERSAKALIEPVEEAPLDVLIPSDTEEASITDETTEPHEAKEVEEAPKIVKHTGLVVEPIVEKPNEAAKPTQQTEDDSLDEINEFAGQAAAKTAKKTEDEAEQKRLQAAQELIDSKKYIVPIGSRRGHNAVLWIGLLVLVVAGSAAGYWYLAQ